MTDEGIDMAIKAESSIEEVVVRDEDFDALQAILTTQSKIITYEEAVDIGRELISFFEALGEENKQDEEEPDA